MKYEKLARDALVTHDALTAHWAVEPDSDEDPDAWLAWHDKSRSAYARWDTAMTALARALDEPDMSRHPYNFRPRCEAIVRGEVCPHIRARSS